MQNLNIDLEKIASLSKLSLQGENNQRLYEDITEIVEFASILSELELDTPAYEHISPLANVLSDDSPICSMPKSELLQNADTASEDYFTVPRVVE